VRQPDPGYSCGKIQANLDGDEGGCDAKCCFLGALFGPCALAHLRGEVRENRGIGGSNFDDICCALFCPGPSGLQTYVESEIIIDEANEGQ